DFTVFRPEPFTAREDGARVCSCGRVTVALERAGWRRGAPAKREGRPLVEEYTMPSGRHVIILAEGRLINLATAEGHPASVMDMSFANQSLAAETLAKKGRSMQKKVYSLPQEMDQQIASLKLKAMGVKVDVLTPEQKKYLASWEMGT
ncbi:MAG: adenosylhomocysteinase, partial [bacterium]|nr:adenosylhomocysteinase [bacterium]